jgi:hypothetical protein
MQLSGFWPVFLVGCFGGALAELIKWYSMRESDNLPRYAKLLRYWLITAGIVICGGVLATLYGTTRVNALLAVNIGASAPLIISSLARTLPSTETTRGGEASRLHMRPSILNFLAGH